MSDVAELMGKTLTRISVATEMAEIDFVLDDGRCFRMYSDEAGYGNDVRVWVEDICGDLDDLLGSPLLMAEESSTCEDPPGVIRDDPDEHFTWTFYRFATIKGYVTIRWYGTSNGYYSEAVDFEEIKA